VKISLQWLGDCVDVPADLRELEDILTRAGLTVERTTAFGAAFDHVVVAEILESNPHPNADRLSVCRVDDGSGTPRQIVCGAKNYRVGDRVPLARPGAVLPGDFKIRVGKLRGVESQGMMCSARELGLAEDAEGLLILGADAPVGAPIGDLFPPDVVLDLEVTPNRPDCLGHAGVAREVAAFSGAALRVPAAPAAPLAPPGNGVRIESPGLCPFYTARFIRGVTIVPSPAWMRRRLEAVGLRPINAVVDVTNYVMMETGQPLHAFDAAMVDGPLAVREAREGERILALDGREYILPAGAAVIADHRGPLAIAGVMGGGAGGVTASTRDVILESALFAAPAIRRCSRALGLASDSSARFERGVDPGGVLGAGARAAELIATIAGGKAETQVLCDGTVPPPPAPVLLRGDRCRAVMGCDVPDSHIAAALTALGLAQDAEGAWQPPSWRGDLTREADLIEEVARIHGIDSIPGKTLCEPSHTSPADALHDFLSSLRSALVEAGFYEVRTGSLVPESPSPPAADSPIRLRNPLGADQAILRPRLVPSLLEVARRNFHHGEAALRIFEVGKTFRREEGREEHLTLALVCCGPVAPPSWRNAGPRNADFFDLKGVLGRVLPVAFRREEAGAGCVFGAGVYAGACRAGFAGCLVPAAARAMDAPAPVFVAEVSLEGLVPATDGSDRHFSPIPEFPSSARDIAILAPMDLPYAALADEIRAAKEPLLASFHPFDLFHDPSGNHLDPGTKSLAISLTFRSSERTLKTEEVNDAAQRIKTRLREKLGVAFRE
jgi:phenylalanyl-tRNA synthetase beta chain